VKLLESSGFVGKWLSLPEAQEIEDLDEASTTELHRQIIWKKPFLRRLYLDFYKEFKRAIQQQPTGLFVELGSRGGFLKRVMRPVTTSDLLPLSDIDLCFTGQQIPFKNHSIDAFFMLNVLHHVKDPVAFFKELDRCLRRLGKVEGFL
jgi:SAM-dependent methyltransferase